MNIYEISGQEKFALNCAVFMKNLLSLAAGAGRSTKREQINILDMEEGI